jgi:hypothetical protein
MKRTWLILLALAAAAAAVQAQLSFITNANNTLSVTGYAGAGGVVNIPSTNDGLRVISIGEYAFFAQTNVTSVTIPGSVTSIGENAFLSCFGLTNATLSNGVASIGAGAFGNCDNLPSITLPGSLTNIGIQALDGCFGLTAIGVEAQNSFYSSVDGVLFDKSQSTLLQFPNGRGGSYTVPGSVTSIEDYAFQDCVYLTNVTMDNDVTNIGMIAFYNCRGLTTVTIPGSVTSTGDYAFEYCEGLTNVTIVNGVTSISFDGFEYCSSLARVTIPGSVTNIGGEAFEFCSNLASVYFQGNAPTVDSPFVFSYDTNARAYYLPGTTGWGDFSTNTGLPVVLWNPLIQAGDASFGVRSNQFGFNITGTSNIPIRVEASANLAGPVWIPLQTLTLTNGLFYFSDPQWTNYSGRFYRISSP